MNRLTFIFVLALAQGAAFGAPAPTPVSEHIIAKTPMDKLHLRMWQQVAQIQRDTRLGKLTKDQAKSLKSQVEAIRKAEIADLKANNSKTLTDDQVNQLNQQLNTLSKSIPIR